MPRISWSLAAALSMSAIAVFRPEIGSKSLAAHAARSITRVVESIAQRFHSGSVRVENTARPNTVAANLVRDELVPVSAASDSETGEESRGVALSVGSRLENTLSAAIAAISSVTPTATGIGSLGTGAVKYSSPPAISFAAPVSIASEPSPSYSYAKSVVSPQTHGRQWKDCAVAAICSGIPGPVATFSSTPQAPSSV